MGSDAAGRRPALRAGSLRRSRCSLAGLLRAAERSLTTPTSGARCVRVRTDVAAVPKLFDYLVPERWADDVRVGSRVRVELHGRRVGGWVVEDDVTPPEGVEPLPLKAWSGWGPPPSVVDLAEWAAWRWAGPISFFLGVGSPRESVRRLPAGAGRGAGARGRAGPTIAGGSGGGGAGATGTARRPCRRRRRRATPRGLGRVDDPAARAHHRSDRRGARRRQRPADAVATRWGAGARARGRLGRAPVRPPGAARLPGHDRLGRGPSGLAHRGREPGGGVGSAPSPGGRRRARCA